MKRRILNLFQRKMNRKWMVLPLLTLPQIIVKANQRKEEEFLKEKLHFTEETFVEDHQSIEEGVVKVVKGEHYEFIVVRHNRKLHSFVNSCPYDGSELTNGVIYEDKFYCPNHGCVFSVNSGLPEGGPCHKALVKVFVKENREKAVLVHPKVLPIFLYQFSFPRDYKDTRKVVIVGAGVAGFACAENLRSFGYTGEILMVDKGKHYPLNYDKLWSSFKHSDYKLLRFRPSSWFDEYDIKFYLGEEVDIVENMRGESHLRLKDGLRIDYDGLLVASGRNYQPYNPLIYTNTNSIIAQGLESHKKISAKLSDSSAITLVNLNLESLKVASTIRREFPDIRISIIDSRTKCENLITEFGDEVASGILKEHQKNGIEFHLGVNPILIKPLDKENKKIILNSKKEIESDMIIVFPENFKVSKKFLKFSETTENIEYDKYGLIKTDPFNRTAHKRIFAAGDAASMVYFPNGRYISCKSQGHAYTQGMYSAINIIGLSVPMIHIPHAYSQQQEKVIHCVGDIGVFSEVKLYGDPKNLDFLGIYGKGARVSKVCGTQNRIKDVLAFAEGIRLDLTGEFEDWKEESVNMADLNEAIRLSGRAGVFRDKILEIREEPMERDILWRDRDSSFEQERLEEEERERNESFKGI